METRIAFDARYINDRYHGIGRYAFRLLEAMVSLAPDRTFLVFRGNAPNSRFSWAGLETQPNVEMQSGPWPLYWPQEQLLWPALLGRSRASVYYSPYFVAPLLARIPAAVTVHDLIFDRFPQYMPMGWSRPYYRLLMRASLRRAKRVFSVSIATAKDIDRFYEVHPGKVVTVAEGVDPAFSAPIDPWRIEPLLHRHKICRPYILAVGARRPHKNFGRLVEAFAGLAPRFPHLLVFAGSADRRFPDEARQAVERHNLRKRVRFLDWIPEADLPGLYARADLLVLPSLIEGFGLPALEAMACGTPVLASGVSSLPEVVGEGGRYFDPENVESIQSSLQEFLSSPDLQQRLAQTGWQRASGFTWEKSAQTILAHLDSAIGKEQR